MQLRADSACSGAAAWCRCSRCSCVYHSHQRALLDAGLQPPALDLTHDRHLLAAQGFSSESIWQTKTQLLAITAHTCGSARAEGRQAAVMQTHMGGSNDGLVSCDLSSSACNTTVEIGRVKISDSLGAYLCWFAQSAIMANRLWTLCKCDSSRCNKMNTASCIASYSWQDSF